MMEYAATRLTAVKSRFIDMEVLTRVLETRDIHRLTDLFSESVFREEMDDLIAGGGTRVTLPALLRVLFQGHLRLRLFFARLVARAFPEDGDLFLSRWELEEIKAAMRYHAAGGPALERRFRFISYMRETSARQAWTANYTVSQFESCLALLDHPLAFLCKAGEYGKDRVLAEIAMERNFFRAYLPGRLSRLPEARSYFGEQADMLNIRNALLLRENPPGEGAVEKYFVQGPGKIRPRDFLRLIKESLKRARDLAQNRLNLRLGPASELSAPRFCRELQKAFLHRHRMKNLLEPCGVWNFLSFMEALDAMKADLKLAIHFSGAGVSPGEAVDQFLTG